MASPFTPQDVIAMAVDVDDGIPPASIVARFERLTAEYAVQNAFGDSEKRLAPSSENAGYLVTETAKWNIFVPWPLVFAFPNTKLLEELISVAERSTLKGSGNIALSGSTTFSGRFASLGDIDLAQYVFEDTATLPDLVVDVTNRSGSAVLVRVGYDKRYNAPWNDLTSSLRAALDPNKRIKLDFIDGETPFGLMPVSNVVLPATKGDHKKGAARQSFVFQEAIFVEKKSGPPWALSMADELLRYLKFLIGDVSLYRDKKNFIKALKRGLSLTRFLGLDEWAMKAEAILCGEAASLIASNNCIRDLEDLWPLLALDAEKMAQFERLLNEKKRIVQILPVNSSLNGEPQDIVDAILAELERMLTAEGKSLTEWVQ